MYEAGGKGKNLRNMKMRFSTFNNSICPANATSDYTKKYLGDSMLTNTL